MASSKSANKSGDKSEKKVITPMFRVSYANVWTPRKNDNDKEVYSVTAIFDADADLSSMKALAGRVRDEKWGTTKKIKMRNPFKLVTKKALGEEEYDEIVEKNPEYDGKIIVNMKSYEKQPGIIGPDKEDITDKSEFYSGCYARASVSAYAYDFNGNKGITFSLRNLMKVKDGEPLSSAGAKADVDFAEIPAEDVDDDGDDDSDDDDDI